MVAQDFVGTSRAREKKFVNPPIINSPVKATETRLNRPVLRECERFLLIKNKNAVEPLIMALSVILPQILAFPTSPFRPSYRPHRRRTDKKPTNSRRKFPVMARISIEKKQRLRVPISSSNQRSQPFWQGYPKQNRDRLSPVPFGARGGSRTPTPGMSTGT